MRAEGRIGLVVFDLYDTLVNIQVDYEKIRQEVKDFFVKKDRAKFGSWAFRPIFPSIDEACLITGIPKNDVMNFINEKENKNADLAKPKPGASETLDYLSQAGILKAVFSRMNRDGTIRSLKAASLYSRLDLVVAREDARAFKPEPDQVLKACNFLKVSPVRTLVVGDHPYDILAGKKAGAFSVGLLTGNPTREDLERAGADKIVSDLVEFLEWFKGIQDDGQ